MARFAPSSRRPTSPLTQVRETEQRLEDGHVQGKLVLEIAA
jgi:hypothetical protein